MKYNQGQGGSNNHDAIKYDEIRLILLNGIPLAASYLSDAVGASGEDSEEREKKSRNEGLEFWVRCSSLCF